METLKARPHRLKDNWFEQFAPEQLSGIDLGCQNDPLNHTFRRWDVIFGDGDATFMSDVPDNTFQTVYASHLLEHLDDPQTALKNWWRILKPGGNLIICVPHRDLYEKKAQPPSKWNHEHKWFWLPESAHLPKCLNFKKTLLETLPTAEIISYKVLDEGFHSDGADRHSSGEYAIEAILKKNLGDMVKIEAKTASRLSFL